jgi:predicted nucleotidyltransferase
MGSREIIEQAVRLLVEAAHPSKIILFGSYARGEASEDSDVDLLVIEPTLEHKRSEMVRLRNLIRPLKIPVDVLVASEEEVREWGHLPGTVLSWALNSSLPTSFAVFLSPSDGLNLAVGFNPRESVNPVSAVASATGEPARRTTRTSDSLVADATGRSTSPANRGLKPTAKVTQPLRGGRNRTPVRKCGE